MAEQLTVGELRRFLNGVSDDVAVQVYVGYTGDYSNVSSMTFSVHGDKEVYLNCDK